MWNREDRFPIESSTPEAKAAAAMLRDSRRTEGPGLIVGIHRAPAGAFYGGITILGAPLTDTSELPRDPQKLLDHIYDFTKGQGKTPDLRAFGAIAESLRTGVVPADLRASLSRPLPSSRVLLSLTGRPPWTEGRESPSESRRRTGVAGMIFSSIRPPV